MTNPVDAHPSGLQMPRTPGQIRAASSLPGTGRMVIEASRTFRCAHTYVALTLAGLPAFVCATCGYRTELLPLRKRGGSSDPATLVNIGRIDARRGSRTPHTTARI